MKLYFAPLACSMATRIAFYEAGAPVTFVQVDNHTKRTAEDEDFLAINPAGQVPALTLDDGGVLVENAAILIYLNDIFASPKDARARAEFSRWIGTINSELHTPFVTVLDPKSPEEAKLYALDHLRKRFALLDAHLKDREFLLGDYSAADGYLTVILNWTQVRGPELDAFPALKAYFARMLARPSIARALGEELPMYIDEQRRRAA